jgi:dTDP-4-amino-4,6-dideoxygalactose transaminase
LPAGGVGAALHYPLAVPQQPAYRELLAGTFPEAEGWARECVSIPCFPEMTEHEIDHVATALAALPAGT